MEHKEILSPCCREPLFDHRDEDGWAWCAQCWKEFDKKVLLARAHDKAPQARQVSKHLGGTPCH